MPLETELAVSSDGYARDRKEAIIQREKISLQRNNNSVQGAVSIGELGIAALSGLSGAIDMRIELETMLIAEISFVWVGWGVPAIPDQHLRHFGLERSDWPGVSGSGENGAVEWI